MGKKTKNKPVIVLSTTIDKSLELVTGFPEFMVEAGWEVHFVTSPGPYLERYRKEHPEVITHEIAMERNPSPQKDAIALAKWVKLLKEIKPDIVSPGTPKASMLCIMAAFITRVPARIYNLWGLRYETATGNNLKVLKAIEKAVSAQSTLVLSASESTSKQYAADGLAPKDKLVEIWHGSTNGVDIETFNPRYKELKNSPEQLEKFIEDNPQLQGFRSDLPTIVFSGRLVRDKGLQELTEAIKTLNKEGQEFQVLILGAQDTTKNEDDLKLIKNLNALQGKVPMFFSGQINEREEYRTFLGLGDIFCLPTYREGFPNVTLEASAMGLPSVTTDATGAIDSVIDGKTGIIVPVADSKALAKALGTLLTDKEKRELYGKNARSWVESDFERKEYHHKADEFFRKFLKG